jgi:thiol-disulfide isomerase/thioredoxin
LRAATKTEIIMEVRLYVYDLTQGMARAFSQQFIGTQIDAVYHTSLVFNKVEYFFGRGIQTCFPGSTHHGRPMEIINMGTTHLPMDTILEYLDGIKAIYSAESYDLFAHNCNNFTNDFGMFLVGKGIPEHITNLPRRVLDTPFGQMLKPQIDASMRSITQAPVSPPPSSSAASKANGATVPSKRADRESNGTSPKSSGAYGSVINVTSLSSLEKHLSNASKTATTIFFTSSTCAPCKLAYPMFDRLAEQYPHALFVKVDTNAAHDVASRYQIRATPTFMTFSRGSKQDEWQGADPNLLKANVERTINETFPPHPHSMLKIPALQYGSMKPITYAKVPPLDKLMAKLGAHSNAEELVSLRRFIETREANPQDATLPKLREAGRAFQTKVLNLPLEIRFAAVDLLRCAMLDPRVSGYFAEEDAPRTLPTLVRHVNELNTCPHNLRLVTIHLACNLFGSSLYAKEMLQPNNELTQLLVQLITSSLLDASHPTARVAASSLAFNLATANYRIRREEGREALDESMQVELAASLVETLSGEDNNDGKKALLLSVGYLVHFAPEGGELMDLVQALDAKGIVSGCKGHDALIKEVASLL